MVRTLVNLVNPVILSQVPSRYTRVLFYFAKLHHNLYYLPSSVGINLASSHLYVRL